MALAQKYVNMAHDIMRGRRALPPDHMNEFDIEFSISVPLSRAIGQGMVADVTPDGADCLLIGSEGVKKWKELHNEDPSKTPVYICELVNTYISTIPELKL